MARMKAVPPDDETRSVEEELTESAAPDPRQHVGPAVSGPAVGAGMPATGETVDAGDAPSEGEVALEREVRESRATPRR